ncbi:hypothetical protein [Zoogloea sp.]|uniref:hypothetical protein n=1 Tax=Zoogloea sp. TaxID=49181 RepID=UPI0035B4F77D
MNGAAQRGLVFFHYFEHDRLYRENLVFFLATAYREDLDFVIVIAGHCAVALPSLPNVRYLHTENKNNDFGGYVAALAELRDGLDDYGFFVFVNSSVRGPFVPAGHDGSWATLFTDHFSAEVALVGSSIAILSPESSVSRRLHARHGFPTPHSHVQTTAYAMTPAALKHLQGIGFYDVHERLAKDDVICEYELRLSQALLQAGWNIKACLARYNAVDYRTPHADINPTSGGGDPLYGGAYFGRTARPDELVFVKTNRRIMGAVQLPWVTLRALRGVTHPAILGWPEYRRLRRAYLLRLIFVPLTELKKSLDRIVRQTRKALGLNR